MKRCLLMKSDQKVNSLVSIIILTHGAKEYVKLTLDSLELTSAARYEVIVVDNASDHETQNLLLKYKQAGKIQKLLLLDTNTFYTKGNNIGSRIISPSSKYILLLNSDVEIKNELWLSKLLQLVNKPKVAAASFGYCMTPGGRQLADGYCILFHRRVYEKYLLDETHEWWHGLSCMESDILREGLRILAVNHHDQYLVHFGGGSGDDWKQAKGKEFTSDVYKKVYKVKKSVESIYDLDKAVGSGLDSIHWMRGKSTDGWCSKYIDFEIKTLDKGIVTIEGYYPRKLNKKNSRFPIEIRVNGRRRKIFYIESDIFKIEIKAKHNAVVHISMKCIYAVKLSKKDIRILGFVVNNIRAY